MQSKISSYRPGARYFRPSRTMDIARPGRRVPARYPPRAVAACSSVVPWRIVSPMGTKSRETIYGASLRAAAERAAEARKLADRLTCEAWNKRTLAFKGPAQLIRERAA
jgi:hypothetical protein